MCILYTHTHTHTHYTIQRSFQFPLQATMSRSIKRKSSHSLSSTAESEVISNSTLLEQTQDTVLHAFNSTKAKVSQKREAMILNCSSLYKSASEALSFEGSKISQIEDILSKCATKSGRYESAVQQVGKMSKDVNALEKFNGKTSVNRQLTEMTSEVFLLIFHILNTFSSYAIPTYQPLLSSSIAYTNDDVCIHFFKFQSYNKDVKCRMLDFEDD